MLYIRALASWIEGGSSSVGSGWQCDFSLCISGRIKDTVEDDSELMRMVTLLNGSRSLWSLSRSSTSAISTCLSRSRFYITEYVILVYYVVIDYMYAQRHEELKSLCARPTLSFVRTPTVVGQSSAYLLIISRVEFQRVFTSIISFFTGCPDFFNSSCQVNTSHTYKYRAALYT